ncbi:MAG: hypothetical protein R3176_02555 [Woeseiaceae bacterium]|nr:hypothetical protein [Woeseiaceae bacterium]
MAEHKRYLPALAALLFAAAVPGAEVDDWSWEDGLLGDSIEGDVFDSPAGEYPGILCDQCRDPAEFLIDFAAVAYNGWWGESPWIRDTRLGMPFRVYNLEL